MSVALEVADNCLGIRKSLHTLEIENRELSRHDISSLREEHRLWSRESLEEMVLML